MNDMTLEELKLVCARCEVEYRTAASAQCTDCGPVIELTMESIERLRDDCEWCQANDLRVKALHRRWSEAKRKLASGEVAS